MTLVASVIPGVYELYGLTTGGTCHGAGIAARTSLPSVSVSETTELYSFNDPDTGDWDAT